MVPKRLSLLLGLVMVVGLVPSLSSAVELDPFSDAAIEQTIRAAGLDPATVVVQRGELNYAGPSCPGEGWTCASTARPVIQAGTSSLNVYECTGSPATSGDSCTVIQVSSSGDNIARCVLGTSANPVAQTCTIDQQNQTGNNAATVEQTVVQAAGLTQTASQTATVEQTNQAGSNDASITQSVEQRSEADRAPRAVEQTQEAHQAVTLDQDATTGSNTATVAQRQNQRAEAVTNGTAGITQNQNTQPGAANATADIDQDTDSGDPALPSGNNTLDLDQTIDQVAEASSLAGHIVQKQSSTDGGLFGDVHQEANDGFSSYDADQTERQDAHGTTNPPGTVSQTQHGPVLCCLGTSKTPDQATIDQLTVQNSNGGIVEQTNLTRATCLAKQDDGCVTSSQLVRNGEVVAEADCTGSSCDETLECPAGESCTTDSASPSSELHKDVRNVSDEEAFGGVEATTTTNATPGDTIEYRFTYHNHGDAPASHVSIVDEVPSHSTFVSCSDSCTTTGSTPGSTITWTLGTIEPGDSRQVFFTVGLDEAFATSPTTITNQGDAREAGAVVDTSNTATVTVEAPAVQCTKETSTESFSGATLVDFDTFPDESIVADGTTITTQYASLGVTFVDDADSTPRALDADGFGRRTISEPNSLFNSGDTNPPGSSGKPLTMLFDPVIQGLGMYIGNDHTGESLDLPGTLVATLTAFDANGNQLCSVTTTGFTNHVETFFGLSADQAVIAKVTLDYGATTLAEEIDNLLFEGAPIFVG